MSQFANLAQQIITTNDQNAYAQMLGAICDPQNLQKLLNEIPHSDVLHFTFTELLSKSILTGQFCPINQTKSDDSSLKENSSEKTKLYEIIIPRIFQNICLADFSQKQYILRSALNAIAICLRDLSDSNKNIQTFSNLMSNYLFPFFKVNQSFTNSLNGELVFLQPSILIKNHFTSGPKTLQIFKYSVKILIELIQYITMVTVYKTYYEYRRNIYTFRNTYLSIILNIADEYHKILHGQWKKNQASHELISALTVLIGLIDKLVTYPFSLTLHEFESDEETKDNIAGLCSDIYFPSFYRNVLCDRQFLDMIFQFYLFLVKELNSVNQLGETIYSLVRILGRIISASVYTFNTEEQRKSFRGYCTDITISFLFNFKFLDSFYIGTLSDIACKVLNSYTTVDLQEKRGKFYQGLIFFCERLVQSCQMKLEDGKRNPFNRAFEVIGLCLNETRQTHFGDTITLKSQQILNKAFARLYQSQNAQKIMSQFGMNQKNQIQCFQQLFQNIPAIFSVNLQANLNSLKALQIQKFNQSQQTIWLHLCALLLPNHLANRSQTETILKYFKVAQNGNTMACLHYMQVLVSQILFEMDNGSSSTSLWGYIHEIQGCTFSDFMLFVIRICKKNFEQVNTDIIDYALQVFKSIYMKLRKHRTQTSNIKQKFDPFYAQVKDLISKLSSTVFQNPKFFKRRVQLFSVISTIWINSDNYRYLQEIYDLVSIGIKGQKQSNGQKLGSIDPMSLLKYTHDMRGLLQSIENSQSFKIICELSINDLSIILPTVLNSKQAIKEYFSEEMFLKAFVKMVLQFVTDYSRRLTFHVQTQLPFLIFDLFKPYLLQATQYQYPKSLITVWVKFASLNPLEQMLPLISGFKKKQCKQFPALIKEYFDNIHRVQLSQLQSLYPYIQDRVQYLCQWWQQVIRRKLYPNVSLMEVVQSRIATTKRQKQELAKLIFYVGTYDQKYWSLQGWSDERQFVKWFIDNYKTWRE